MSLGLLAMAAQPPRAQAQDPYSCLDELDEAELNARLASVDRHLQTQKLRARLWWYGWQSFFGAVLGYQVADSVRAERGTARRWISIIGATGASLAMIQMWIMPLPAAYAPQRYRRMPAHTRAEREAKLAYGLDAMETSASRERGARGAAAHVVSLAWSATWATTLGIEFDAPARTTLLVVGGLAVTQARIWSAPQAAISARDELRQTVCAQRGESGPRLPPETTPAPTEGGTPTARRARRPGVRFGIFGAGAQLVVTF